MITKPKKFDPIRYYSYYVEKHNGNNLLTAFKEESESLLTLLEGIDETKASYSYQEGKWTIKQVLMHIIDTEQILANRALRFARGEKQELTGFDENYYAKNDNSINLSMKEILDLFDNVRDSSIAMFKTLSSASLENIGVANKLEYTPRILGWFILGHQIHHIEVLMDKYLR